MARRQQPSKAALNLVRLPMPRQPEPVGNPPHVSIHRDRGPSEDMAQHHVGGLASHACQRKQFFHRRRHLAVKALDDGCCGRD